MSFCTEMMGAHRATQAFAQVLVEADLLAPRQAAGRLPDGRPIQLGGLQVVDAEKLQALPVDRVGAWHRNGWLSLIYTHQASLQQFQALLTRQAERDAASVDPALPLKG
jgi:hypothetical protein